MKDGSFDGAERSRPIRKLLAEAVHAIHPLDEVDLLVEGRQRNLGCQ